MFGFCFTKGSYWTIYWHTFSGCQIEHKAKFSPQNKIVSNFYESENLLFGIFEIHYVHFVEKLV